MDTYKPEELGVDASHRTEILKVSTHPDSTAGVLLASVDALLDNTKTEAKTLQWATQEKAEKKTKETVKVDMELLHQLEARCLKVVEVQKNIA